MATQKTSAKKVSEKTKQDTHKSNSSKSFLETTKTKIKEHKFLTAGVVLVVLALLYTFKGLFVAAVVNGQPIYRLSVVSQLEKQSGGQVLDAMVNEAMIRGELRKQNVTVSQEEINAEIKKISELLASQKQTLDEALKQRGMTKKELEDQIYLNKGVEKLLGKDVAVTDSEIAAFIEQNRPFLQEATDETELQRQAKEQLTQQKVSQKYQQWMENTRKNAKVFYFVNYNLPQQ